ncbi:unknown [[Mannheimia] succiniciproducens MBEL55E]|uniref:Uncharacterized protein n=1 Tax=Mannheimia succiniciproducens (strain KCTC 0769BP / MBEL55E) TaxID=221988 RepID=Q65PW9_MANSM|nr:unknown [[Mannheimia] succiniciproducens MBEL55E]
MKTNNNPVRRSFLLFNNLSDNLCGHLKDSFKQKI